MTRNLNPDYNISNDDNKSKQFLFFRIPFLEFHFRLYVILIFLFSTSLLINAQYIPVHPSNAVYDFLTEMSNSGVIDLNTQTSTLSREQISGLLLNIDSGKLNYRQKNELKFYLKDFNKELSTSTDFNKRRDLFCYIDSGFSFTVNPILGGNFWTKADGSAYHWWNGAEAWATTGNWGFWGSLRDNHESERLTKPDFMNQNYGGANFKGMTGGKVDYWEYRGGMTYDFGIGSVGIIKDHFSWGSNYNGANILSGRTPSFPRINFELHPVKWFEFKYFHGWLTSGVVDSARSFNVINSYATDYREVYHSKFIAANLFTFKALKKIFISFGNSIIYDYDQAHLAYFIPVIFYKAVDHQLNSGIDNMNAQMFFDVSVRPLAGVHLYSTLLIDEMAVKRITDSENHNFYSFKAGGFFSNLIPNTYFGAEYTKSNALTFRHYVTTTTYESNAFNLGHYLEDNAEEIFLQAGFKPVRNMDIKVSWCHAIKGPDHTLLGTEGRASIKSFTPVVWESDQLALNISWQMINDVYLRVGYSFSNIRGDDSYLDMWTADFRQGNNSGFNLGLNVGW